MTSLSVILLISTLRLLFSPYICMRRKTMSNAPARGCALSWSHSLHLTFVFSVQFSIAFVFTSKLIGLFFFFCQIQLHMRKIDCPHVFPLLFPTCITSNWIKKCHFSDSSNKNMKWFSVQLFWLSYIFGCNILLLLHIVLPRHHFHVTFSTILDVISSRTTSGTVTLQDIFSIFFSSAEPLSSNTPSSLLSKVF